MSLGSEESSENPLPHSPQPPYQPQLTFSICYRLLIGWGRQRALHFRSCLEIKPLNSGVSAVDQLTSHSVNQATSNTLVSTPGRGFTGIIGVKPLLEIVYDINNAINYY